MMRRRHRNPDARYMALNLLDRPVGQPYTAPRQVVAQPTGWTEATGETYSDFDAWLMAYLQENGDGEGSQPPAGPPRSG